MLFSYHARAGKGVPAQPYAIALLNVVPLLLESVKVHLDSAFTIRTRTAVVCEIEQILGERTGDQQR